ncbi:haloacid dehalogenase, type II [Verruconis gallopava]|uniref:Haloacid dehalogenase, type II n=1 Tax=Verruconis gallopava TaxID=253628 RepID=A0A0D1YHV6_9PEZI|nr:haloacid dehalogenase, type II [Verruconis gallopava]KIW00437.1 haloacid dehalogenase, type II [Verruconis gallopava]
MTETWRPKAIIFDLLTALLDSWSVWDQATTAAGFSASQGHVWRKRYLEITFGCGAYKPYEELTAQAARDVGLGDDAARQLNKKWGELEPWPEVRKVLGRLREKGYKLGIVTNCSAELGRRAAGKVGVDFDAVVTAEEAGFYKPREEAYQAGIKALGLTSDDVLFVAGSSGDVVGAAAAGMRVVWNNHIGLEPKPGANPMREGKSLDEALVDFL